MSTHISAFKGQMTQLEVGTSLPTSREMSEYLVGNDDGLDDGDAYFVSTNGVLGIRTGGSWKMIMFSEP